MNKDSSKFNISDNDIRVVGQMPPTPSENEPLKESESRDPNPQKPKKWLRWVLGIIIAAFIIVCLPLLGMYMFAFLGACSKVECADSLYVDSLSASKVARGYCIEEHKTMNDVALRIITPHDAKPELITGRFPLDEADIVLAAMAADVRADNEEIAGAFVERGQLIAKGHPKKGFCAIIGDEVTIGMDLETPLFEKTIDDNGYFFRQFAVVHDGKVGETTPKGDAIRRALCKKDGTLSIIESEGPVSYADFARALVDYGVNDAIGLMGAVDLTLIRNKAGEATVSDLAHYNIQGSNYIIWR